MTISGIPAHPLLVHFAVVGVPVVALLVAYAAIRPAWHARHKWLVTISAALATALAALTNNTGEALMVLKGASEAEPGIYGDHATKAKVVMISAAVMLVLALIYHFVQVKPLILVVRILAVVAAIIAIIGVVMTGHAGAALVWAS